MVSLRPLIAGGIGGDFRTAVIVAHVGEPVGEVIAVGGNVAIGVDKAGPASVGVIGTSGRQFAAFADNVLAVEMVVGVANVLHHRFACADRLMDVRIIVMGDRENGTFLYWRLQR